jgi:uncharacterized membrane protein YeaQ/YmgE (transglycosylase-associated protein family)
MKENADYQLDAVRKAGFTAVIIEKKLGGGVLYTVVVGEKGSVGTDLLGRLRKAGFDGFVINK